MVAAYDADTVYDAVVAVPVRLPTNPPVAISDPVTACDPVK